MTFKQFLKMALYLLEKWPRSFDMDVIVEDPLYLRSRFLQRKYKYLESLVIRKKVDMIFTTNFHAIFD